MARAYRLGERAEAMERTRARIVESAASAYAERGIRATSVQEVARRARVSPATVLHHFPKVDALQRAVVADLMEGLAIPTEAIFRGARSPAARVERLAVALARFYERSEPWYRIHTAERERVPALVEGEERFHRALVALTKSALGPLARRRRVLAAVMAFTSPPVLGQLRAGGESAASAGRLVARAIAPWLAAEARRSRSTRRR